MNRFELSYGKVTLNFELSSAVKVMDIVAKVSQPIVDVEQAIRQAVANPIGTAPLIEVVKPGDKVVIVVSDVTRLWVQADVLLPVLLDVLNGAGVPDKDISIVTSTGDHRLQTIAEHTAICGHKVLARVPIFDHECHATDLVVAVSQLLLGFVVMRQSRKTMLWRLKEEDSRELILT